MHEKRSLTIDLLFTVDCHDGSDGQPIINHGGSSNILNNSTILLKDVFEDAIKPYAFCSSDYPLILSIENHCSPEQQDIMADIMKHTLGDQLYIQPVDDKK